MRLFASGIAALVAVCSISGCQSISSTMLNRLGDNSFVGNSNGHSDCHNGARSFKGVPVTLYVPSHLDVYIEEVYYAKDEGAKASELSDGLPHTRILNVRTDLIKTKKVFTVDCKRPSSGTLNMQSKFSDEQYFQSIASASQDTTIIDSANLVNTILDRGTRLGGSKPAAPVNTLPEIVSPPTTPKPGEQAKTPEVLVPGPTATQLASFTKHIRDTRVVAFKRFDINESDFECQVDAFIAQHLNNCDRCGTLPSYDAVPE